MKKTHRPGMALIETLLLISALALILGLSTSLLVSTIRITRNAEQAQRRMLTRNQFAERFRADVAGATGARIQDGTLVLRVSGARAIHYTWKHDRIERTEDLGKHVQRFALGDHCDGVEFQAPPDGEGLVVARIRTTIAKRPGASVSEITAALRGDLR